MSFEEELEYVKGSRNDALNGGSSTRLRGSYSEELKKGCVEEGIVEIKKERRRRYRGNGERKKRKRGKEEIVRMWEKEERKLEIEVG